MNVRTYNFETYNPVWNNLFTELEETLRFVFKNKVLDIQHVGSTSVPEMKAKPIIDILVVLEPFELTVEEEETLTKQGFSIAKDIIAPMTYLVEQGKGNEKKVNIHIVPRDHKLIEQTILSRDYLRTHQSGLRSTQI